ncbi:MAG: T9SS type A sorting domain-containing protein [Bacteroidetes bacterium]|nr:T9SS type A sorting domain-containing protein [Bacteroidota bacterium]
MTHLSPCIYLFLLLFGVHAVAMAQNTFERAYGGERFDSGSQVLETADGGFIVLGTTRSVSNDTTDAWVVRTDAKGDTLWTKTYGGNKWDSGIALQPGSDGGYVLVLSSNSVSDNYDILLIKIDEQGGTVWSKVYGGPQTDYPHAMASTNEGGYVILAHTLSFGMGSLDYYLLKVDQKGDSLWSRTYGGVGSDWGGTVQQTADGGYILSGDTQSFGDEDGDVYLVKTDAAGDTLWTRTYGGAGRDRAYNVQQTRDNGYLVVGYTEGLGAAEENGLIIKTDAAGEMEWTQVINGDKNCRLLHARELSLDDYLVAGSAYVNEEKDYDAYLLRLDGSGSPVWTRYFGGTKYDQADFVGQTSDGGFVFVGGTESFGPDKGYEMYLVKTDGDGNATDIDERPTVPSTVLLHQNYPNPFNPTTTIRFELPRPMNTSLVVTDALGREVARLSDQAHSRAGTHSLQFDATGIPSGVYLYRLETEDAVLVRKLMLIR